MADADLLASLRALVIEVVREELQHAPSRDRYLATNDAAALASVAEGTIRRWVREGRLPGHRAGRVLRVRASDLEALLAKGIRAKPPTATMTPEQLARRDFGR